ncbi:MAG: DUF4249 domain-containing protein [Arcicella sp.]|jgi:hypothetical protein|nr:DUF4249 domain-containing protein [Arcicella sp.]
MKNTIKIYGFLFMSLWMMTSCEDVIQLDVPKTDPYLVVDATITNLAGEQVVKLTKSQDLLTDAAPEGVKNATVTVTDNTGKVYEFKDLKNDGKYVWKPTNQSEVMGAVGKTYTLEIKAEGETYRAVSELKRVPKIDSIVYRADEANLRQQGDGKPSSGYEAQFYAIDPRGVGDCYRVKVYQNGKLRSSVDNIIIAYDAIGNKSPIGDGLMFILPIRRIAATELFVEKDKIKVELTSITEAHFDFWLQLRQELNNAGLFARPASRIPSNINNINANSSKQASGWFGTSAVSSLEVVVDKAKAVKEFNN